MPSGCRQVRGVSRKVDRWLVDNSEEATEQTLLMARQAGALPERPMIRVGYFTNKSVNNREWAEFPAVVYRSSDMMVSGAMDADKLCNLSQTCYHMDLHDRCASIPSDDQRCQYC